MTWKAKKPVAKKKHYDINPFEFYVGEEALAVHKPILEPCYEDAKFKVKLFLGDCIEILAKIPDDCVDLIFADPPYFLSNSGITCHAGKMVSVNKGEWDVSKGMEENHEFNLKWLGECQRVLKKNGTIWVSGTSHIIYSVGFAMQQLGYKILNDIVWYKTNAPPNLSCRYFTHSTETVLWVAKDKKSKHVFNYAEMKAENKGKQMRNVWQISAPGADEKKFGKHPTQKPVALLDRIIRASSNPGDLVLDPFCGSGTTGVSAVDLGRRFVGIEQDAGFIAVARKRLEEEMCKKKDSLFYHHQSTGL